MTTFFKILSLLAMIILMYVPGYQCDQRQNDDIGHGHGHGLIYGQGHGCDAVDQLKCSGEFPTSVCG